MGWAASLALLKYAFSRGVLCSMLYNISIVIIWSFIAYMNSYDVISCVFWSPSLDCECMPAVFIKHCCHTFFDHDEHTIGTYGSKGCEVFKRGVQN